MPVNGLLLQRQKSSNATDISRPAAMTPSLF
jgi:hypothetical protein